MGIQVEFNPDLALRKIDDYKSATRSLEECIPENLESGFIYNFLKRGQRNYWLLGEIPLLETEGNEKLSRPLASILILETTHFIKDEEVWTKGKYQVKDVFDLKDAEAHFESYARRK